MVLGHRGLPAGLPCSTNKTRYSNELMWFKTLLCNAVQSKYKCNKLEQHCVIKLYDEVLPRTWLPC